MVVISVCCVCEYEHVCERRWGRGEIESRPRPEKRDGNYCVNPGTERVLQVQLTPLPEERFLVLPQATL